MTFNWEVSVGDIVAFIAFIGSLVMFVLTTIKQTKSKMDADGASSFYDAAKKYYDFMIDETPNFLWGNRVSAGGEESEKANCDVSIVRTGSSNWVLKVFNKGTANANNVSFKYLVEGAPEIITTGGKAFPIKLLEPQKNVDYHFMVYLSTVGMSWEYDISWINDDGEQTSKKGVLTLPLT
jgi:hypothetical protein